MRYWGYFGAKAAVALGLMYGLLRFLNARFSAQVYSKDPVLAIGARASTDLLYTVLFGAWVLSLAGWLFFAFGTSAIAAACACGVFGCQSNEDPGARCCILGARRSNTYVPMDMAL